MKEANLTIVFLSYVVEFDGRLITRIKFDLEHINRGWNKEKHDYNLMKRSNYTVSQVTEFFEQFAYYTIDWEEKKNKKTIEIMGERRTRYVAYVYDHDNATQRKIVVDMPEENLTNEVIIITIY